MELVQPVKFSAHKVGPIDLTHDGKSLDIEQLSDGTISLLSWTLDYLQKASEADSADAGLILLDEIDRTFRQQNSRLSPSIFIDNF